MEVVCYTRNMTGKKGRVEKPVHVNLIMPASVVDAVDDWVRDLRSREVGAGGVTRADVIRDIVKRAVDARRAGDATMRQGVASTQDEGVGA